MHRNGDKSSRRATSGLSEEDPVGTSSELSTVHDANKRTSVECYERLSIDDQGFTHKQNPSPGMEAQLKPPKETDPARSRQDASRRIDPPKATIVDTQPPSNRIVATESIPPPSATSQQFYRRQSRGPSNLRNKRRVEDASGTLPRRHEEKSRKLSAAHDEHKEEVEMVFTQKQSVERHSSAIREESEVQTRDIRSPPHESEHCVPLVEEGVIANRSMVLERPYEDQCKEFVECDPRQTGETGETGNLRPLERQPEERSKNPGARNSKFQRVSEEKEAMQSNYAVLRQDYDTLRIQHDALRHDYLSVKVALEQCTSELRGMEKFLITADTFSGAEVLDMVRKLNTGVQQSVTSMAEWMVCNLTLGKRGADVQIVGRTGASELLGARIMGILGTRTLRNNPILLEIALQAYLMYELHRVASRRTIKKEDEPHIAFIDEIYKRMREAEGQAISGNWRALTNLYAGPARLSDPEITHIVDTGVVPGISDILLATGCTVSKPEITSLLGSKFAKKICSFVSLAARINRIIGEGVVSEDLEVLVVPPGGPFDAKSMDDWDDSGVNFRGKPREVEETQETVLCAAELGLMKRTKGEPSTIIVKPKVVLVSVLDIING